MPPSPCSHIVERACCRRAPPGPGQILWSWGTHGLSSRPGLPMAIFLAHPSTSKYFSHPLLGAQEEGKSHHIEGGTDHKVSRENMVFFQCLGLCCLGFLLLPLRKDAPTRASEGQIAPCRSLILAAIPFSSQVSLPPSLWPLTPRKSLLLLTLLMRVLPPLRLGSHIQPVAFLLSILRTSG